MENNNEINNSQVITQQNSNKRKTLIPKILFITICFIVVAIVIFIKVSSHRYTRMIENGLNNLVAEIQERDTYLSLEPFKCSGVKIITCKTNSIKLDVEGIIFHSTDNTITIEPKTSILHLDGETNGSIKFIRANHKEEDSDKNISIPLSIKCSDNMTLAKSISSLKQDISCTTSMQKIDVDIDTTAYIKDEIFAEKDNILQLGLFIINDVYLNEDASGDLFDTSVFEKVSYKVFSEDSLLEAILSYLNIILATVGEPTLSKGDLVSIYETNLRENLNLFFNDYYGEFVNLVDILDNIIYNEHNTILFTGSLKEGINIDDLIETVEPGFRYSFFSEEDYYDIKVQTFK